MKAVSTYLPAIGLFGLAVYQVTQGDLSAAYQSILSAMAVFGIGSTAHAIHEATR